MVTAYSFAEEPTQDGLLAISLFPNTSTYCKTAGKSADESRQQVGA
jgi:hypothetical protein